MKHEEMIDKLNELGMVRKDDPNYKGPKGWDETVKALEKNTSPAAQRLLKRLRSQKGL